MKLKKLCTLISLFCTILVTAASSQNPGVVWTEPAFPTQFDDVTVYFDATQGNGALAGFLGDVYAHTGVITSASSHGNDWRYVIGNWGTADPRVLMTRVDDDLYTLSYNITDFYGVPSHEAVLAMGFVFRDVNGTIVGRDTDGSDIFTPVYPSDQDLFLSIRSPGGADVILFEGDSLLVDVVLSDSAFLEIFDNDDLIFADVTDGVAFHIHPFATGVHVLRIVATADTMVTAEVSYMVIDRDPERVDPPDDVVTGLNYFTDSTYLFLLHAPFKEYAFVLCPANDYRADPDFRMHLANDDGTYWIELPRAFFSNGNATYQYLVSDKIRIADPFSEVVLDPVHDPFISAEVMATLPPYPAGMTTGIVTAFDEEYVPFPFTVDNFEKPEIPKLIIYEMLLRDFLHDHSFATLKDTLDYFVRLGVNAIELMPVNEFEGNISWGYNPSFHMAVDKYYGTREQLKAFIDAAHERGIAVILDVVYNHVFSQSPLAQMYWDPANFRPAPGSPYLNVVPRHPFNVGYDVNHESPWSKAWVKRILEYLLTEFRFDGFRFDLSKGFTQFNSGNNADLMAQYDAGRIAILKDYADHVWSIDPTAYVIMEHFAVNSEETELSDYGMMLWGNINHQFAQAAKGFRSELRGVDYTHRGWNDPHLIGYMESHDEERLMWRVLNEGDMAGGYNARELPTALERIAAVSAIYYSVPGPKMLWQFGELGYDFPINWCTNGTINFACRLDPKPIRWDYLQHPQRERLWRVTAALMHLRTHYPTFSTDDFIFNDGNLFLKTVHLNHPEMDAVTLANFRVINSDINPKFQYPGVWYEYFSGDSIDVVNTEERITFGPGEFRIYTSERIVPPGGFITRVSEPQSVHQIELVPNPVTAGTWLYGQLPEYTEIRSAGILDITGNTTGIVLNTSPDGTFSLQFPDRLPAGMYFLHLLTDEGLYVGKIAHQN